MLNSKGSPTRNWAEFWGRVASGLTGMPPFEAVYTGPAWEMAVPESSVETKVWKMAVLQRRPPGGAEHWGHLFLLLGSNASKVILRAEGGFYGAGDRPPLEVLPPAPGLALEIRTRPATTGTSDRLRAYALAFQRSAAALVREVDAEQ
jgi:hypothetical protein